MLWTRCSRQRALLWLWHRRAAQGCAEQLAEETEASLVQCKIDTVTMQWGTTVKWQRRWMLGHGLRLWEIWVNDMRAWRRYRCHSIAAQLSVVGHSSLEVEVALRTVGMRMLACVVSSSRDGTELSWECRWLECKLLV